MLSFNTNPASLRFGKVLNWRFNNVLTKSSLKSCLYLEIKILNYFLSILNTLTLDHFSIKNKYYSSFSLSFLKKIKFKSPLVLGNSNVLFRSNKLIINLFYYFDTINSHPDQSRFIEKRFSDSIFFFKGVLHIKNIFLYQFNYHNFVLGPVYSIRMLKPRIIRKAILNCNYDKLSEFYSILRSTKLYSFFIDKLKHFSRNQYFYRVLNIFFSSFCFKSIDLVIISNIISFELTNLRKKHKLFITFVFSILTLFFTTFKFYKKLRGLYSIIKGRIIPFNREYPRSIKRKLSLGNILKNNMDVKVISFSKSTQSRFGAINIQFHISFFEKSKVSSFFSISKNNIFSFFFFIKSFLYNSFFLKFCLHYFNSFNLVFFNLVFFNLVFLSKGYKKFKFKSFCLNVFFLFKLILFIFKKYLIYFFFYFACLGQVERCFFYFKLNIIRLNFFILKLNFLRFFFFFNQFLNFNFVTSFFKKKLNKKKWNKKNLKSLIFLNYKKVLPNFFYLNNIKKLIFLKSIKSTFSNLFFSFLYKFKFFFFYQFIFFFLINNFVLLSFFPSKERIRYFLNKFIDSDYLFLTDKVSFLIKFLWKINKF